MCFEGEPAAGIFGICSGQVKEYLTSALGKAAIIRIAGPGDVIGLEAVMGDSVYQATVEAIEPTTAYFITIRDLLSSMRSNEGFRLAITRQLSDRCRRAYKEIRQFGSAVPARVARFLLEQQETTQKRRSANRVRISLTREEIAQSIGSSRETVSRIVTFLQRRQWIQVNGKEWRIQNKRQLAAMATEQEAIADASGCAA